MRTLGLALLTSAAFIPACALAQDRAAPPDSPDEIIVLGNRNLMALRLEMLDRERMVYDTFNRFNDERRFNISCSMHQPTGTRLEVQVCEPEFEIQARRSHARHYLENLRDYYNQIALGSLSPTENTPPVHVPPEALIAAQRQPYREKIEQVAREHPEFLEALVRFTESKQRYEQAVGRASE